MQISLQFQTSDALKALAVQDPQKLVQELEWLGDAGEYAAASKGYVTAVVSKLSHHSPDVVAAAAEALGKMGRVGASYADEVGTLLGSDSQTVKLAACKAIGKFGSAANSEADKLTKIIKSCSKGEEDLKVAAIEALGLIKPSGDREVLAKLLEDPSSEVVSAACCALGVLGASQFADDIAVKLKDVKTRNAAVCALLELGVHRPGIVECLSDDDVGTRLAAVDALSKKGRSSAAEVCKLLKHSSAAARSAACLALGSMGLDGAQYVDDVATLLNDEAEDSSWMAAAMGGGARRPPAAMRKPRVAAIRAIGLLGDESLAPKIADYTSDSDWEVRLAAAEALGHLGDGARDMSGILIACLSDATYPVRAKTVEALGRLGVEASQLPDMLNDKAQTVRIETCKAIAGMGESGQKYTPEVAALLSDSLNCVKVAAAKALAEMGENSQCYASVIASFLQEEDPELRLVAVEVLPKLGNYGAAFKDDIESLLQDPYPPIQEAASKAFKLQVTN